MNNFDLDNIDLNQVVSEIDYISEDPLDMIEADRFIPLADWLQLSQEAEDVLNIAIDGGWEL